MIEKVAVFVDISNLYHTVNNIFDGKRVNYEEYLRRAVGDDYLIEATAYGAQLKDEAQKFMFTLRGIGFNVKFKAVQRYPTKHGENRKADWDVGMAMDMVRLVTNKRVTKIVLGSADGDMVPVVNWLAEQGIKTHIIASRISKDLRDAAYSFEEIDQSLLIENEVSFVG